MLPTGRKSSRHTTPRHTCALFARILTRPFPIKRHAQVFKEFVGLILGFLTRPNQVPPFPTAPLHTRTTERERARERARERERDTHSLSLSIFRALSLSLSLSLSRSLAPCVYVYISLSLALCVFLSLCVCVSLSLCVCVSLSLSFSLGVCAPPPSLFICLAVWLSGCLAVWLSGCLSVSVSLCASVPLCLCLCLYFSLFLSLSTPTAATTYVPLPPALGLEQRFDLASRHGGEEGVQFCRHRCACAAWRSAPRGVG